MEEKHDYSDEEIIITRDIRKLMPLACQATERYVLLACGAGELQFDMKGESVRLQNHEAFVLPPATNISHLMLSTDVSCGLVAISATAAKSLLQTDILLWDRGLYIDHNNHLVMDDKDWPRISSYYELMMTKVADPTIRFHRRIVHTLVQAIMYEYLSKMQTMANVQDEQNHVGQGNTLFRRFLDSIANRKVKHISVEEYANELCINPKYLSQVCKKISGKTALDWIQEYTLEDIRHALLNTELSIKEIAFMLGFDNVSFFGKYVKQHFGCPPLEYRNGNNNQKSITITIGDAQL